LEETVVSFATTVGVTSYYWCTLIFFFSQPRK
jgi:hypothetical protein